MPDDETSVSHAVQRVEVLEQRLVLTEHSVEVLERELNKSNKFGAEMQLSAHGFRCRADEYRATLLKVLAVLDVLRHAGEKGHLIEGLMDLAGVTPDAGLMTVKAVGTIKEGQAVGQSNEVPGPPDPPRPARRMECA